MRVIAMLMAAVFVLAAGTSFAFGDCAGHNKAQLVKTQPQEQISKDQPLVTPVTVAKKTAEPVSEAVQTPAKK